MNGPGLRADVTNTVSPHTTGDDHPRPGISPSRPRCPWSTSSGCFGLARDPGRPLASELRPARVGSRAKAAWGPPTRSEATATTCRLARAFIDRDSDVVPGSRSDERPGLLEIASLYRLGAPVGQGAHRSARVVCRRSAGRRSRRPRRRWARPTICRYRLTALSCGIGAHHGAAGVVGRLVGNDAVLADAAVGVDLARARWRGRSRGRGSIR